ncbi:MAG: putative aminohydrolase SsnA, partial [Deltaproteobacteria bacterium]|nr:putative aminohydrolase SsnA [Deltaproteobacteria bacterium]
GAVHVESGLISEVGGFASLKKKHPKAEIIDADGGIIMPGLVNSHMHLYSTFARGMAIKGEPPKVFLDILKSLWWRLDQALTAEDIYYSALIALIECVKCGTTAIIDHHASPNFAHGSLQKIEDALKMVPIRASLCYEVSDRDGVKIANEGIKENERFIRKHSGNNMVRGMFGMHASFTVSEKTLERCIASAKDLGCGMHVHTAEGKSDLRDCKKRYGCGVVERWNKHGILGTETLLAHCVHISDEEIELLAKTGVNVAHNPYSNMNNAVGAARTAEMLDRGVLLGLGTDGMSSDMFLESKFAHMIAKHENKDPRKGFAEACKMLLENNYKILSNLFGWNLGEIKEGLPADIIVCDYKAPTPISADNFSGHFLYGLAAGHVVTTIVNGKVLMKDRELIRSNMFALLCTSRSAF